MFQSQLKIDSVLQIADCQYWCHTYKLQSHQIFLKMQNFQDTHFVTWKELLTFQINRVLVGYRNLYAFPLTLVHESAAHHYSYSFLATCLRFDQITSSLPNLLQILFSVFSDAAAQKVAKNLKQPCHEIYMSHLNFQHPSCCCQKQLLVHSETLYEVLERRMWPKFYRGTVFCIHASRLKS